VCNGSVPASPLPASSQWPSLANARCTDSVDNDGNNYTDCLDFSCSHSPIVTACNNESSDATCSDGIDNDNNTHTDCDDFSCSQNPYVTVCNNEYGFAKCSDGIDNDGNGFVDCADFACKPKTGTANLACQ
jgi:hypothetical protein